MDEADVHQIRLDVARTHGKDFGITDPTAAAKFQEALEEVLLCWLRKQTKLMYIQGLNELMALCLLKRTKEEALVRFDQLVNLLPDGIATVVGSMQAPLNEAVEMALFEVGEKSPRLKGHLENIGVDMYLTGLMPGWYLRPLSSQSGLEAREYVHEILLGNTEHAIFDTPFDLIPHLIAKIILKLEKCLLLVEDPDKVIDLFHAGVARLKTARHVDDMLDGLYEQTVPTPTANCRLATSEPIIHELQPTSCLTVPAPTSCQLATPVKKCAKKPGRTGFTFLQLIVPVLCMSTWLCRAPQKGLHTQHCTNINLPKMKAPSAPRASLGRAFLEGSKKLRMLRPAKQPK